MKIVATILKIRRIWVASVPQSSSSSSSPPPKKSPNLPHIQIEQQIRCSGPHFWKEKKNNRQQIKFMPCCSYVYSYRFSTPTAMYHPAPLKSLAPFSYSFLHIFCYMYVYMCGPKQMLPETDFHPAPGKPIPCILSGSFRLRFSGSLAAIESGGDVGHQEVAAASWANVAKICHNICYTFSGQFFIASRPLSSFWGEARDTPCISRATHMIRNLVTAAGNCFLSEHPISKPNPQPTSVHLAPSLGSSGVSLTL